MSSQMTDHGRMLLAALSALPWRDQAQQTRVCRTMLGAEHPQDGSIELYRRARAALNSISLRCYATALQALLSVMVEDPTGSGVVALRALYHYEEEDELTLDALHRCQEVEKFLRTARRIESGLLLVPSWADCDLDNIYQALGACYELKKFHTSLAAVHHSAAAAMRDAQEHSHLYERQSLHLSQQHTQAEALSRGASIALNLTSGVIGRYSARTGGPKKRDKNLKFDELSAEVSTLVLAHYAPCEGQNDDVA